MKVSSLRQHIYDNLFNALACLGMLDEYGIEEVAKSLENPGICGHECKPMFMAAANVVRMAKNID